MTEKSYATLSLCGQFRYSLTRVWDDSRDYLTWIMLNPSTADADKDDATIRRVRGFTKREGFGGFVVVNVYAFRATDPKDLHAFLRARSRPDKINLDYIKLHTKSRDVVAAWGGKVRADEDLLRAKAALRQAERVRCLGLTKGKLGAFGKRTGQQPFHPLMLKSDVKLKHFSY